VKIVDLQSKRQAIKSEEAAYFQKLMRMGPMQREPAATLERMRKLGGDDEQIAEVLRHAIEVLKDKD